MVNRKGDLNAKMVSPGTVRGSTCGKGHLGSQEQSRDTLCPQGRPESLQDPVLWPTPSRTGKTETSRTSPSSQGLNTLGCALWQDLAECKGVRSGTPREGLLWLGG